MEWKNLKKNYVMLHFPAIDFLIDKIREKKSVLFYPIFIHTHTLLSTLYKKNPSTKVKYFYTYFFIIAVQP